MRLGGNGQMRDANVLRLDDRETVGLVELGRDLGQELVRRDGDRAGEPRRLVDGGLERLRYVACAPPGIDLRFARVVALGAGRIDVGEIDVDLVDAAVLDARRNAQRRRT
jgi:hypothetical protein